MVTNIPSATLKFDTDFDFVSSNAQFIKEELEREIQGRMNMKGWLVSSSENSLYFQHGIVCLNISVYIKTYSY